MAIETLSMRCFLLGLLLLTTWLTRPVCAEEIYVRNKLYKGHVVGKGATTQVELSELAAALHLQLRQAPNGGCYATWRDDSTLGADLAGPSKVIVEGQEMPTVEDGDRVLVNLKQFAEALGARFQINTGLDSIDVNFPTAASAGSGAGYGSVWTINESGWRGTWTRQTGNTYDAVWKNAGQVEYATLTITVSGDHVKIERRPNERSGNKTHYGYEGQILPGGTQVKGRYWDVNSPGHQYSWSGTIRK
ncbi:MAG: hypothetical protein HY319_05405 [Armatimonadetes bacterium]|nr:hypothetical protein [Armatimonadota bacterium]